ncbi:MAG: rhombosortase [Thiolinea sp.]
MRYERSLILQGDYWRLLSAHFVHLNFTHLALNLAGWWLFLLVCGHLFSYKQLTLNILILSLGISLSLLILRPDYQWYLGFSGVLYGLLLIGSLRFALQDQHLLGALIFTTLVLKMALDIYQGQANTSAVLIGAPVATVAHIYGLIIGLVLSLPVLSRASRFKLTQTTKITKHYKNKK